MPSVFLIGDTHFGHANMLTFTNWDGSKVRPFQTVEEMDETMVERWNSVVKPHDKVYHLGDVAIAKRSLATVARLNGRKVLIRGNHDIFKLKDYTEHFYDIRGSHKLGDFILSHIPIHPESLSRWCKGNVHGHLHNNVVNQVLDIYAGRETPDPRYFNVSVERINYTPVALEEIGRR
jgi:calcineurin-like phosphoesterase family protein